MRTIYRIDLETENAIMLNPRQAASINIREKQIENWMATNTKLLFSNPDALKIIAQEITGELMADILAVDSQGNLIIIEIKRHGSDRGTIGQLLDYAARLSGWTYADFDQRWKTYSESQTDLFEVFKEFVENPDFDMDDFLRNRRLYILASSQDESMTRIITWLRDTYSVPIDFVLFQFYEDNGQIFLDIEKIEIQPVSPKGTWSGDWFFNTNETYGKGAYVEMLKQHVIAIWGYESGDATLRPPAAGDRVFAYVNRSGVVAVGRVVDAEPFGSGSVFGKENEREFHRKVSWDGILDVGQAISAAEVSQWGYNMPVRSTLCRINNSKIAERIAAEVSSRAVK